MFGAVSGAHFNPVVTLVDRAFGTISTRDAGLYIVAQIVGGCLGAIVANLMFDLPAVELSTTVRSSGDLWLSEVVATVGLLLVIHGCVRTGRADVVAVAVGVWIGGAYWFTSSTSFANPAVTIARTLSDTFAGIEPVLGADVHRHAARRRRPRLRPDPLPLPTHRHDPTPDTDPDLDVEGLACPDLITLVHDS